METVSDFILGGSKITADCDCSHEIKRRLLLGRKVMINLDSILKSRDITLPTKVRLVKAMVLPVVKYGCESWTVRKAKHWKINAFELWCWRRLLRVWGTLLIIFYYVMNLWRLRRSDFIPLALLDSDFYLSLASGGQKRLVSQWRKR